MSPTEQITRFIAEHPGEWQTNTRGGASLTLQNAPGVMLMPWRSRSIEVTMTLENRVVTSVGPVSAGALILPALVPRVCDKLNCFGGCIATWPSWLKQPVRQELLARAAWLLALANDELVLLGRAPKVIP